MEHKVDQIEGQGFIPNIYHYFWLKDPILDVVPLINIPDTVLFKANQPYAWYFEMNNTTKRKMKENISLENIEKSFLRKCENQEIIAMWVTKRLPTEDKKDDFIIEYLGVNEFKQFCNKVFPIVRDGCLQRFIQPKGLRNYIIKAHWSPKMCFLERIENYELFSDKKKDIYKRVITFENDKCITNSVSIKGQILPGIIEKIIYNLVTHIQNVTEMKINRLCMNFKIDVNKRLWFLFCSQLSLEKPEQKTVKLNQQVSYQLPHFIDCKNQANLNNNIKKGDFCLGECGQQMVPDQLYKVQFSVIIQSWEYKQILKQKKQNQKNSLDDNYLEHSENTDNKLNLKMIPTPILKLMPKLKVKEYILQKNDPQFRDKLALVCETCLIKIIQYIENSEKISSTHKQPSLITKHLDPSKTKRRFHQTDEDIKLTGEILKTRTFARSTTNKFSQLETNKTEFKKSIFYDQLMPIKDLSTLATMEFNSNSKISKIERIDNILQNHPKKNFLKNQITRKKILSVDTFFKK